MKKYSLIIVDDHKMFRDGLNMLLSDIPNIDVVGQASNGQEFLDYIEKEKVDIALMDINMPLVDGIEATRRAIEKYPDMMIIALSMFGDEEYYYKMIDAGVKGFVLKESDSEELEKAIEAVIEGGTYFSQELLRSIIANFGFHKETKLKQESNQVKLSTREIEILRHICNGLSNAEIAELLFISQRTVERHRANLLTKTNTKNSISLVMFAIKNNLIEV